MLVMESAIAKAAEDAGMKVPPAEQLDTVHWDEKEYVHFHVFCVAQLGRPCPPGAHFGNAKIIAGLSDDEIKTISSEGLLKAGFRE